ncbi:MAG TPA: molecular chaperone DnaK, partial [Planctomycetaceae bacterium]|nr:molecular chaperone DnaK [Planctomycetaceae bacterium]
GPRALCLCPAGLEPGQEVDLTQRQFRLLLGQPIEFPLFVSSTRLTDKPGEIVPIEREQLSALPPIRTVLKVAKTAETGELTVIVKARLTEIGTLDLWCSEVGGKRSWKLLFDVRSATQTDVVATESLAAGQGVLDDEIRLSASDVIRNTFRKDGDDPATLMQRLSDAIGLSRLDWPTTLLRQLWEVLIECEPARRLSPQHEARWLNLLGFSLRPGYGLAVDDWRVAETWKQLHGKLAHPAAQCRVEWWILWRRIAGGLTAGQQQSLASPVAASLKDWVKSADKPRGLVIGAQELAEQCRLLGSLEWLSPPAKQSLGPVLLEIAARPKPEVVRSAALWAIGRLGGRRPVYGPLNAVISPEIAAGWLRRVMQLPGSDAMESFALMQLARKTGDRYRDIDDALRGDVLKWMDRLQSPKALRRLVREVGTLEAEDQGMVFGEALPRGLRIL